MCRKSSGVPPSTVWRTRWHTEDARGGASQQKRAGASMRPAALHHRARSCTRQWLTRKCPSN
eukprot:1185536-Pyramimonas_sp.AAC.1